MPVVSLDLPIQSPAQHYHSTSQGTTQAEIAITMASFWEKPLCGVGPFQVIIFLGDRLLPVVFIVFFDKTSDCG